jgi:DNA-directed RNA polymerase subunit RPC12/RpoP
MATMVPNRRSTFGITCVQCHEELIAPDKSEYRAGTHIRHLWRCSNCSARFESIEQIPVEAMTSDDIFSIRGRGVVRVGRGSVRKDAEHA